MAQQGQRSDGATVGEAVGLVAADVRRLEEMLAAEVEEGDAKAGLLADLADVLFGDEERALTKGYQGIMERARSVVGDATKPRPAFFVPQDKLRVMRDLALEHGRAP